MEDKDRKFDRRYLEMAEVWAKNSYCTRRQVGALLVKDRMIMDTTARPRASRMCAKTKTG